jgi:hypothetical protein
VLDGLPPLTSGQRDMLTLIFRAKPLHADASVTMRKRLMRHQVAVNALFVTTIGSVWRTRALCGSGVTRSIAF